MIHDFFFRMKRKAEPEKTTSKGLLVFFQTCSVIPPEPQTWEDLMWRKTQYWKLQMHIFPIDMDILWRGARFLNNSEFVYIPESRCVPFKPIYEQVDDFTFVAHQDLIRIDSGSVESHFGMSVHDIRQEATKITSYVVNWGAIASIIARFLNFLPDPFAELIVAYASPLAAFIQQNIPATRKNWHRKNNIWFIS